MIKDNSDAGNTAAVIMVYAHGGKPVQLELVEQDGETGVVRNPATGATTGISMEFVYDFDAVLFESLAAAHESGDSARLEREWAKAKHHGVGKPGPEPERLKIEGDWKEAARKGVRKEKPPEGWPSRGGEETRDEAMDADT